MSSQAKVTSIKQVEANKKNALKSTGPKSMWGKHNASGNAVSHGLHANKHLVIGEQLEEFEEYRSAYLDMLAPINPVQEETALQIISAGWRLRRYANVEAGLFDNEQLDGKQFLKESYASKISSKEYEDLVNESYRPNELQGLAFTRNCNSQNGFLKLSTIEQRLLTRYYKLLDIYASMQEKNSNEET